ncbi:MAG: SEL1-like repeat protein [Magnetococcales bacterium]|nr:SEL1-like repeat protein [Magnetococcales bacterium]
MENQTIENKSVSDCYEYILGDNNRFYYIEKFKQFDKQGPGLHASWNWSAFFFAGLWAAYRKLYGWFFVWWGFSVLVKVFDKKGYYNFTWIIAAIMLISFAAFANSIYHAIIFKRITTAQSKIKDESELIKHLRNRGGGEVVIINCYRVFFIIIALIAFGFFIYTIYFESGISTTTQPGTPKTNQTNPSVAPSTTQQAKPAKVTDPKDPWYGFEIVEPDPKEPWAGFETVTEPTKAQKLGKPTVPILDKDISVPSVYRKAAYGDAVSQLIVGILYAEGRVVQQSYADAARWYRKSADQGIITAQYLLGELYYYGEGVTRSLIQAYLWMYISVSSGGRQWEGSLVVLEKA